MENQNNHTPANGENAARQKNDALDNLNEAINSICDLTDCLDMLDNIQFERMSGAYQQNYENQMTIVLKITKQKGSEVHKYITEAFSQYGEA